MPGKPLWNAARRRNYVDVDIPVIFAGERDLFAVGREMRPGLDPNSRGEPLRHPSLSSHCPQVAGEYKYDLGRAQRRLLEQQLRLAKGGRLTEHHPCKGENKAVCKGLTQP